MASHYMSQAGPTSAQMTRIKQQQVRNASYSTFQSLPNVAAITLEDVGRRTLVPTRTVAWNFSVAGGTDAVAAIDATIGAAGFPINVWSLQNVLDREELYGDTIVAIQSSIQCSITSFDGAAAATATDMIAFPDLADSLEQLLYQRYSLVVNPTSGNRSPIIADTELRAFSPVHRLSGADGYTATMAIPASDEFFTCQITQSTPPVVGAYALTLPDPGLAGASSFQLQGCISVAFKKVRGTG